MTPTVRSGSFPVSVSPDIFELVKNDQIQAQGCCDPHLVEELLYRTEMTLLDAINVLRRGSQENNSAPPSRATIVASTVSDDDDDFAALLDDASGVFPRPPLTRPYTCATGSTSPRKDNPPFFFNVRTVLSLPMYLLCPSISRSL